MNDDDNPPIQRNNALQLGSFFFNKLNLNVAVHPTEANNGAKFFKKSIPYIANNGHTIPFNLVTLGENQLEKKKIRTKTFRNI